jgi:hypothetical protein
MGQGDTGGQHQGGVSNQITPDIPKISMRKRLGSNRIRVIFDRGGSVLQGRALPLHPESDHWPRKFDPSLGPSGREQMQQMMRRLCAYSITLSARTSTVAGMFARSPWLLGFCAGSQAAENVGRARTGGRDGIRTPGTESIVDSCNFNGLVEGQLWLLENVRGDRLVSSARHCILSTEVIADPTATALNRRALRIRNFSGRAATSALSSLSSAKRTLTDRALRFAHDPTQPHSSFWSWQVLKPQLCNMLPQHIQK